MSELLKEQLADTEKLLTRLLEDKRELQLRVSLLEHRRAVHETIDDPDIDTEDLIVELRNQVHSLEQELMKLRATGLPSEVEIFIRAADEHGNMREMSARPEHLYRLCDANGITALPRGQFLCGNCGGVRDTDNCELCELKHQLKESR